MLDCLQRKASKKAIPVVLLQPKEFEPWLKKQEARIVNWFKTVQFKGESGNISLLPDKNGKLSRVVAIVANFWGAGALPCLLPYGEYYFEVDKKTHENYALAWGLGAYQFDRYKKTKRKPAILILPKSVDVNVENIVDAIHQVRDLINTPTDDMGPTELANISNQIAKKNQARIKHIVGKDLLKQNFASIFTVGRASDDSPRLIDMQWGNKKHPHVVLVGKGVCFDSGGLDIKNSASMLLMKKDMAGAAHVLGLAQMIIREKLKVNLRVLIPAVENVISGNAYRPGDVIKSRKGLTIEIGNTDAEGRVVLADALTEAVSRKPDLIIDIATLTGAARVALGTELPAVFSNNDKVCDAVMRSSNQVNDPVWRLPLFTSYREGLNSSIADINNNAPDSYAGAIVAALFLQAFVPDDIPWLHYDLMAWNLKAKPGRPQGGEAMAIRGLFAYLKECYK